jgi:hypothetical protein
MDGRIVLCSPSLTLFIDISNPTPYVFRNTTAVVKKPTLRSFWTLISSSPHMPQLPPNFLVAAVYMVSLGFGLFLMRVDLTLTPVSCHNALTASSPHCSQPKHEVLSRSGITFGEDPVVSHGHTGPEQTRRPRSARPIPADSVSGYPFSFQEPFCAAHRSWR